MLKGCNKAAFKHLWSGHFKGVHGDCIRNTGIEEGRITCLYC